MTLGKRERLIQNKKFTQPLREKSMKGVHLAIEKLIAASLKNDDYLVYSENGKIVRVKARELKK
jgi:hypothetical protein